MKKTLLLFFGFLLFCNIPSADAQCYGTVHFDQSVAPLPVSSSNISYTINSTYCNEIIMIGYDGFTFTPGDTGQGPVTVDGNAATWINTSYTKQLANSYWETAETWAQADRPQPPVPLPPAESSAQSLPNQHRTAQRTNGA